MASFVSYSPVNGEPLGSYPVVEAEAVACTVKTARKAAKTWAAQGAKDRVAALERLRLRLAEDADLLAQIVTEEIGKPLQESYGADLLPSLRALTWLRRNAPRALRSRRIGRHLYQEAQPYGVVGVIGTWNYPLFLNIAPIAWALAAGNAVVWKPSELATGSALALAELFQKEWLPVFVVTGSGETGRALCEAGCDKIAFTGGVATGRDILKTLAQKGTPSVMELSGNDIMLVLPDTNIFLTAKSAVWGRCCNAGQSCVAPQRIYVLAPVYEAFLEACQREIAALRPGIDYGPLRTEALRRQTHRLIWAAISQGARLLSGGFALEDRPGYFYAPTLLADCDDAMPVMAHDFFGPVLAVCRVATEAEAVERANASSMALGASIWTRNLTQAQAIAAQLHVGVVSVNNVLLDAANPALPFGGLRASGFGKQRGGAGLEEFVQWKAVATHSVRGNRRHLFPYREATLPILRGVAALQAARSISAKWRALRALVAAARDWPRAK
jgi:acyl-CoA reductase-like NAD-dependent aldehyde dehydrogenase